MSQKEKKETQEPAMYTVDDNQIEYTPPPDSPLAPYVDEEPFVDDDQALQQIYAPVPVEDIGYSGQEAESTDRAIAVREENGIIFAEGIGLSMEELSQAEGLQRYQELEEMIASYTGVTPQKVGDWVGHWMVCIGAVLAPFERTVKRIDPENQEEYEVTMRWRAPLFKLLDIDKRTEQHMVLSGGGGAAVDFIKRRAGLQMRGLQGLVGDFPQPIEIMFSSEERSIQQIDRSTGEVSKSPGRLFRISTRAYKGEKK